MIKMREKQEERDALKQLIDQTNLDRIVMEVSVADNPNEPEIVEQEP